MWNRIDSILTFSVYFLQSGGSKYPYDRCPWICLLDNHFIINLFKGVTDQLLLFIKKTKKHFHKSEDKIELNTTNITKQDMG